MNTRVISFFILLMLASSNCLAEEYKLSERTIREFKSFSEMGNDMGEMQRIGNILLAVAPFRFLLDGADPLDAIEISQEPWHLLGKASQGLSSHYKSQLKQFCEFEALSQHKSRDDFRFWKNLAKQF